MDFVTKKTLERSTSLKGKGLHTGTDVTLTIHPGNAETGIIFRRLDLFQRDHTNHQPIGQEDLSPITVEALATNVISTRLGTTIAKTQGVNTQDISVATIEHLMAALALTGIDCAIIDLDGPEVPILDGSASPFVEALQQAGTKCMATPREAYFVETPFEYRQPAQGGDQFIRIEPDDHLALDVEISFDDPAIGRQSAYLSPANAPCRDRMTMARTFCELKNVEHLQRAGLCQGGSLENTIVVDGGRMLNGECLRDPQEFVLHKAMDLLGDLRLLGAPLAGRITTFKPGHDLNNRFCRALLQEASPILKPQPLPEEDLAQVS